MTKYLTVGTKKIEEGLFRSVQDTALTNSMKPKGGLWLTEYNEDIQNYNHWVDFMLMHPNILFYKNKDGSVWEQPCSIVTLQDAANILFLDSKEQLDYLMKNYPYNQDKFSYEKLSQYFDGIFVDLGNLVHGRSGFDVWQKFSSFGVSSLVLFNLSCIDYYYSGDILIEPFDFENSSYHDRYYDINYQRDKKKVLKKNV